MANPIRAVMVPKVAAIPPGDIPAPEWLAVSSEVSRIASRTFDVRAFGATGDGVTDDTDAIEAAIAAIPGNPSYGGAELVFPNGMYVVSRPIVINKHGVHVRSYGGFTAILKPTAAITTDVLTFAIPNSTVRGAQISNIRIMLSGAAANGIRMEGVYDNVMLANVFVDGLNDGKVGIAITDAAGASTDISQTVVAINCWVNGSSGTAAGHSVMWDLNRVQEATFINCKGVGTSSTYGRAFRVRDCRRLLFDNCSASRVGRGWSIGSVTREVRNVTLDQPYFEELGNPVVVTGTASYPVTRLAMRNPSVQSPVGAIGLTYATAADLETANIAVTIDATAVQSVIKTRDLSQVTNNGVNTTLIEYSNSLNVGYTMGPDVVIGDGTATKFRTGDPVANGTSAFLLVNDGTTTTLRRVMVGAADSAGTGFRTLRVAN